LLELAKDKKYLYADKWRDYRDNKIEKVMCLELKVDENLSSAELFFRLTEIKIGKCKNCESGNLIKISKLTPRADLPP
jgi:hypothetical protein